MTYIYYYIILIICIGFVMMGMDKRRAIKHQFRIRERTIWIISIVGGAIGMSIGMYVFRHKTKHPTFLIGLPMIACIQIGLFIYFS